MFHPSAGIAAATALILFAEEAKRKARREGRTVVVDKVEVVGEEDATIVGKSVQAARNEPCPCGSGQKYKRCCLGKRKGKE